MTQILKGKPAADELKEDLRKRIEALKEKSIEPKINVIRMGENPDDISYEKGIVKNAEGLGIKVQLDQIPEDASTEDLLELIQKGNDDESIHGMIIFRPLPKQIDEEKIVNAIDQRKDVDCMNPINLARVFEGDLSGNVPATPLAAIRLLKHYGVDLVGANVVCINRSLVFGRPFTMMALNENATPTICHSRTKNMEEITKNADVVVTAQGRARCLGEEFFTEDSIIVDVGMSPDENGDLAGDADFDDLQDKVKMISPTFGGVGAMTSTILLEQVVKSAEQA